MNSCLILIALSINTVLFAQLESRYWYFGGDNESGPTMDAAGLDFENVSSTMFAITNSNLNAYEGCAVMSDKNTGDLLFYTNSLDIWDKSHNVMPNGTGLMGDISTTQSSLVLPSTIDRFYVFTSDNTGVDGLFYSMVNMNLPGNGTINDPLGDVIPGDKNIRLYNRTAEKLVAVEHKNENEFWVLSHTMLGDTFLAFHVTPSGIDPIPVKSNVGYAYPAGVSQYGYLKASPDGKHLVAVMGLQTIGAEYRSQLFDFDNATGIVKNPITIGYTANYGASFSPDSKKLYVTETQSWISPFYSKLFQFDLCDWDSASIVNSRVTIDSTLDVFHAALQLGMDGKMYMASLKVSTMASDSLAVIDEPNKKGVACNYRRPGNGIYLNGRKSRFGLPNFLDAYFKTPEADSFTVTSSFCHTDTVYFMDEFVDSTVLSRVWNFGDTLAGSDNIDSGDNSYHIFSDTGTYLVRLLLERSCEVDTLEQMITINHQPVGEKYEIFICEDSTVTLSVEDTIYDSYLWSTGEISSSIEVQTIGEYFLELQLADCFAESQFDVLRKEGCISITDNDESIFTPNVFSPNNNDHNDKFYVMGENIEFLKLMIYDRWGNQVFETSDINQGWDGTNDGLVLGSDVYTYHLEYKNLKESINTRIGNVTLLR